MTAEIATEPLPHINDLFDAAQLVASIEAGLVRARQHPTQPLTIYNYAEMAVYTRSWNAVTSQCRGLIVDHEDSIIKRELFEAHVRDTYAVRFVLDDRNQVVRMWRSLGLTCLQVADGAF